MEKVSVLNWLSRRGAVPLAANVNLKYLVFPLFIIFLVSAPLMRGLFFPADLYPHLIGLGVVLLVCAAQVLLKREEVFRGFMPFGFLWLATSYGVSCFVAASRPEAVRGFLRYLGYFAVFWIASYLARTRSGRKTLALSIFAGATFVALIGVSSATQVFVFPGAFSGGQIMSTLQYPNALAAYLLFSSVIGLTLMSVERNVIVRTLLSMATVVQVLVFLGSYSRGGWVVYPIAIILLFIGMPRVQRAKLAFYVCTTLTAVLLVVRRFTETIAGKTPAQGLKYVLFGLAISLSFEIAYMVFARVSSTLLSPPARRVLGWAGGVYAAVTFTAYLVALAGQYSSGVGGILSASMLNALKSINVDDPSLLTRGFWTGDAFRLWLQHPLLGGGAGAWNAWYHTIQTVLYWTTEVHNHFAQVLVETGILGFTAYLFIWGGLVFATVKLMLAARRHNLLEDSTGVALTWGMAVACIGLGIHSVMDFELSLPGVAVQLWAAFGVVYEATLDPRTLWPRSRTEASETEAAPSRLNGLIAGCAMVLVAAVLIAPPVLLSRGAYYGRLGAAALMRSDFHIATQLYDQAETFDPFSGGYALDKAQAYAAKGLLGKRDETKKQAAAEVDRALKLEPFNLTFKVKAVEVLTSLGEIDEGIAVSKDLIELLPLDPTGYESLARLGVVAYVDLTRDTQGALDPQVAEKADALLQSVTNIPQELESLKAKVVGIYRERWNPEKLNPTATLNTYVGQAYYLGGDLETAMSYFQKALDTKQKPPEAQVWMTASRILAGQLPASGASGEVASVLSYYRSASR